MHLEALPALADNYIWVLVDDHGRALVVDPGEAQPVQDALAAHGWSLHAILLTHHHHDHVGGAAALRACHPLTVYGPEDERIAGVDQRVGDRDHVQPWPGGPTFQVMAVPGHTRSHIAYAGEGLLFCGDTLFRLGCGRLFEGTPAQMLASLDKLAALPDATLVCCGHEYTLANGAFAQTVDPGNPALEACLQQARQARAQGKPSLPRSLGEERATNPFLRCDSPAIRRWAARQGADEGRLPCLAALRAAKDVFRA